MSAQLLQVDSCFCPCHNILWTHNWTNLGSILGNYPQDAWWFGILNCDSAKFILMRHWHPLKYSFTMTSYWWFSRLELLLVLARVFQHPTLAQWAVPLAVLPGLFNSRNHQLRESIHRTSWSSGFSTYHCWHS